MQPKNGGNARLGRKNGMRIYLMKGRKGYLNFSYLCMVLRRIRGTTIWQEWSGSVAS